MDALRRLIRDVPGFPKPGIVFKDITPLLQDGAAFAECVRRLAVLVPPGAGKIVAVESRGFILGAAVAHALGKGFVPVRKAGKLPWEKLSESYDLEYGTDTVEMHRDAVRPGEEVVMLDDVLATGGTASAACRLIGKCGGRVGRVVFLLELGFLNGREKLEGYDVAALLKV